MCRKTVIRKLLNRDLYGVGYAEALVTNCPITRNIFSYESHDTIISEEVLGKVDEAAATGENDAVQGAGPAAKTTTASKTTTATNTTASI